VESALDIHYPGPMEVSLFIPCLVDRFLPSVGEAAAALLRAGGHRVSYDPRQTCCGQPAFNAGSIREARALALRFLDLFGDAEAVVAPSGSCVAMVRHRYGELPLPDRDLGRWAALAPRVEELGQFLERTGTSPRGLSWKGRLGLHHSCHFLRELDGAEAALRRILSRVRDLDVVELPSASACCGFGGTFSAKLPGVSVSMGSDKLDEAEAAGVDGLVLADAGCLLQLRGIQAARGRDRPRILHYAELLVEGGLRP